MRTNTDFNKIAIDSGSRPRAHFGLAHEVNTTAGFGDCQPLQCRLLVPNSKTTCSIESLVRMAPMVSPTAGKLRLKTWSHFVGMSDLLRSFSKFLVGEPYASASNVRIQQSTPKMRLCDISLGALIGCHITIYEWNNVGGSQSVDDRLTSWRLYDPSNAANADAITLIMELCHAGQDIQHGLTDSRFPLYYGTWFSPRLFGSELPTNLLPINNNMPTNVGGNWQAPDWFESYSNGETSIREDYVTLEGADYVFVNTFNQGQQNERKLAFAVRLSAFGKRYRKALIGLGYQLNFVDKAYVNILPLFAYYKAYFDVFGLTLYQNYESTSADLLLKQYDAGSSNFDWGNASWCNFVYELGSAFVTDTQDFISAHQKTDAVSQSGLGFINNIVVSPNFSGGLVNDNFDQANDSAVESNIVRPVTNHVFIDKVNHSEVDSELLKVLYKWTNRNTIAGRRIAELLRAAGYGKYVDEQKSNFIGYTELDINVMDVNATADTFNASGDAASVLGEPAGKGFGYDEKVANKKFSFENDEFGYWITIAAIVPNSGYCQALDPLLYDTDRTDFYAPEFDGLGMEFTKNSVVKGSVDWNVDGSSSNNHFENSFGLVPRFTRYKVAHDILNGDFSLRGVRDGYLPYTLDKFIDAGNRSIKEYTNDQTPAGQRMFWAVKDFDLANLPIAGNAWRFNSRYPWLNNFERIFTSFADNWLRNANSSAYSIAAYELLYNCYDSFMIHNVIDMQTYAPMLPIEDSYGTTDENSGKSDASFVKA